MCCLRWGQAFIYDTDSSQERRLSAVLVYLGTSRRGRCLEQIHPEKVTTTPSIRNPVISQRLTPD